MPDYSVPFYTWAEIRQLYHGAFPGKPKFTEAKYPSLDGKVVLVTGANTGVGYETVKSLAGLTNAKVYILGRGKEKTLQAIKRIELEVAREYNKSPIKKIGFIEADLSDLTTIKPAVEKFLSVEHRLDIAIFNAGMMHPRNGAKTVQGHELTLGTNAIGHHLLQKLLDPIIVKTAKKNPPNQTRIVWVSSTAHFRGPRGGLDFNDPNSTKIDSSEFIVYAQSKCVNAVQARYWQKAHPHFSDVVCVSICPGFLSTSLHRNYGAFGKWAARSLLHPVRNGAYTELYAALSPDITTANNGNFYISWGVPGSLREDLQTDEGNAKIWYYLEEQVAKFV